MSQTHTRALCHGEETAPELSGCHTNEPFFFLEISFITHSTEEKTRFGPKAAARPLPEGRALLAGVCDGSTLVGAMRLKSPGLLRLVLSASAIIKQIQNQLVPMHIYSCYV